MEIKQHDENRERDLTDWGLRVVRFKNEEVEKQLEVVIKTIEKLLVK